MKNNKFKKIFSAATALALAAAMPLCAVACGGKEAGENATPTNTDKYTIPQDYARTYYEVFVRSFSDGNGDGIGDLRGLINNLDYLNDGDDSTTTDLGINGIWLMPIHPSPSYHKYDVKDYYDIDPQYGTLSDFKELIEECEKRGIWVQMDLVLNHTSNQHEWFKAAVASAKAGRDPETDSAMSKYVFVKSDTQPSYGKKWQKVSGTDDYWYLCNFDSSMPDLNLDNEEVREEILTIVKFWLQKGVRSFRLDAVPWACNYSANYNEQNGEFWTWFSENCDRLGREVYGNKTPDLPVYCYNVGEVWGGSQDDINSFFGTGMSCFNYELAANYNRGFSGTVNGKQLAYRLADMQAENQAAALAKDPDAILSNFLSCHDNNRSGSNHFGFDVAKIKQAAALYMLSPGNAYIYYGEEIGAGGDKYGDNDPDSNIRLPFNWGDKSKGIVTVDPPQANYKEKQKLGTWKSQTTDANSVLTFYRQTIKLRNRFPEIARGIITPLALDGNGKIGEQSEILTASGQQYLDYVNAVNKNVSVYSLTYKDSTILIVHNIGADEAVLDISDAFAGYEVQGELKTRGGKVGLDGSSLKMSGGTVALLAKPAPVTA